MLDKENDSAKLISSLRIQRGVVQGQQTRMKNTLDARLTVFEAETKLGLLEGYMQNFQALQSQLEVLDPDEIESDKRALFEDIYCTLKSKLLSIIEKYRPRHSLNLSSTGSTVAADSQTKRMARIYGMFEKLVDENIHLSTLEKFQHLRSCLSGGAATVIAGIEMTEENYSKAIDLLKRRFDNKRHVFKTHIKALVELQSLRFPSAKHLRDMSDVISKHIRCLLTLGTKENIADGLLLHIFLSKLDPDTQARWQEALTHTHVDTQTRKTFVDADASKSKSPDPYPTWDNFCEFLEQRSEALEYSDDKRPTRSATRPSSLVVAGDSGNRRGCTLCSSLTYHSPFQCETIKGISADGLFKEVKRLNLCINCLRPGHNVKTCKSSKCKKCSRSHHTLLHLDSTSSPSSATTTSTNAVSHAESDNRQLKFAMQACASENVILGTAIIRLRSQRGDAIVCRALLDGGSQLSFLTERVAQLLSLQRQPINETFSGICMATNMCHSKATAVIESLHSNFATSSEFWILPKITGYQPSTEFCSDSWKIPQNISLADPAFNKPNKIDMLLGASVFYRLLSVGQIDLGEKLPIIQKTLLGWIVAGKMVSNSPTSLHTVFNANFDDSADNKLESIVSRFWEMEDTSRTKTESTPEEQSCENHFALNTTRDSDGRFVVRLPFKQDTSLLGNSYEIARKRFLNLEKRLSKSPLKADYATFIKEYSSLGHMERLSDPATVLGSDHYFLPHHCVMKEDSSSTKLRVVYNGSCATDSGISLNDVLMVGPTLQDDLFSIIIRFRHHKYAMSADIVKMYRMVWIHPADRVYQLILWREVPEGEIEIFVLKTVTYGTASASFLATRALIELANIEEVNFPIGAAVVKRDFFVDNLQTGDDDLQQAMIIKDEVTNLFQVGGFTLRKWCSNEPRIIEGIPVEDHESFVRIAGNDVVKSLGLYWNPTADTFIFSYPNTEFQKKITKRIVLSEAARLFDPLGLVNPIIVLAKIFLQELWKRNIKWDESLPMHLHSKWEKFRSELMSVNQFSVPRHVKDSDSIRLQLHGFADASAQAYGGVLYVRSELSDGSVITRLLCSKSRVAPLRATTIPRLELSAALLLSELIERVLVTLTVKFNEIVCWTDSQIVIAWIASPSHRWNSFVANRVSKIQSIVPHNWRYVPSHENPADIISRGAPPSELLGSSLWFTGPEFIRQEKGSWPISSIPVEEIQAPEFRKTKFCLLANKQLVDLVCDSKFINSYRRLVRVFAYVRLFIDKLTARITKCISVIVDAPSGLTVDHLNLSVGTIVRHLQRVYFAKDYSDLQNTGKIQIKSRILNLAPFLDKDGIIRVGGRIGNSDIPYDARHQMLLPQNHPFTSTLLNFLHYTNSHAGCQTLVNITRQRFWIVNLRGAARKVIHRCIRCFRCKPSTYQQVMGSLPTERVTISRPFAICGVDFCGPLYVRNTVRGRAPNKAYLSIFVCFSTKAVHFELVTDLSTPSFLLCLKRFIARRGRPTKIYSDNATNFVGANNKLRDLRELFTSELHSSTIKRACNDEGIKWCFIPPRSPHFGGLWESSVKLAKHHVTRVVANASLVYEEMLTVIYQAEAVVNSRPITTLSQDPNDLEALTPAHFLTGGPLTTFPEPNIIDMKINSLTRYQRLTYIQQQFWRRWKHEYLQQLQVRSKWLNAREGPKVGQLVLVKDDNAPPLQWPLARIVEVNPGPDGRVRIATVRTAAGKYTRAIVKLCPLPIEDNV